MKQLQLKEEKLRVRRELKETAAVFSGSYVSEASRAVCEKVLQSREFREASVIFGYLSFRNEISVDAVFEEALRLGLRCCIRWTICRLTGMASGQRRNRLRSLNRKRLI